MFSRVRKLTAPLMSNEPKYMETGSKSSAAKISFLATGLAILIAKRLYTFEQSNKGEVRDQNQYWQIDRRS